MTLAAVLGGRDRDPERPRVPHCLLRLARGGPRPESDHSWSAAIVALLLAPLARVLLQLALSRRREVPRGRECGRDSERRRWRWPSRCGGLQLDTSEVVYADRATAHPLHREAPPVAIRGSGAFSRRALHQTHPTLSRASRRSRRPAGSGCHRCRGAHPRTRLEGHHNRGGEMAGKADFTEEEWDAIKARGDRSRAPRLDGASRVHGAASARRRRSRRPRQAPRRLE
jgi:hypothetical protein